MEGVEEVVESVRVDFGSIRGCHGDGGSWQQVEMVGVGMMMGGSNGGSSVSVGVQISSVEERLVENRCRLSAPCSRFLDIDQIFGKRETSQGTEYFVKWKGLSCCFNSWVGASAISSEMIHSYESSLL